MMPVSSTEEVVAKIQKLIDEFETNKQKWKSGEGMPWLFSATTLIESICSKDSVQYRAATSNVVNIYAVVRGALISAKQCLEDGLFFRMHDIAVSEVFSDFFEMADSMLKDGYHPAAAVAIVGAVLEDHLRKMCAKYPGDVDKKDNGDSKALGALNEALGKVGAYNATKKQQVDVWTSLRNKADHGKFEEVTPEDASAMLKGVCEFCALVG